MRDLVYLITGVQEGEGGAVTGEQRLRDKSIRGGVWILLGSQFKQTHCQKTFFRQSWKFQNHLNVR